jgi:hypothetical protein
MRQLVQDAGFDLVGHLQTLTWSADVFVRRPGAAALRRTEPDPDAPDLLSDREYFVRRIRLTS